MFERGTLHTHTREHRPAGVGKSPALDMCACARKIYAGAHIFIPPRQALELTIPCYRYLTVRTFSVDFFEKAVHRPYLWSSRINGELRYNFKVIWTSKLSHM